MELSAAPRENPDEEALVPPHAIAFAFPGDNSYDGRLFRELYAYLPYLGRYLDKADVVARRAFRQPFLPLVELETLQLHDQRLERCPDLAHLGVVLTGVLVAESLREQGIRPDLLVGDGGLGDVSALVVAGSIDLETGLRVAADRAIALRESGRGGDTRLRFEQVLKSARIAVPQVPVLARMCTPDRSDQSDGQSRWFPLPSDFDLAQLLLPSLPAAGLPEAIAAARTAGCEHVLTCAPAELLSLGSSASRAEVARRRDSVASSIASVAATMRRTMSVAPVESETTSRADLHHVDDP